jgi:hypothetical protein
MPGLSRPLEKFFFAIPESVLIEIMPQDAGASFWPMPMASLHRLSGREAADALHVGIEVIINSDMNMGIYMMFLMH